MFPKLQLDLEESHADLVLGSGASEEDEPLVVCDLALLCQDLHTQHEAVNSFVLLEQASGDVGVGAEQGSIQKDLQPRAQLVVLLRRLHGVVEQL